MFGLRHGGNEGYASYLHCRYDAWIDKHLERSVKHCCGERGRVSVVSSKSEIGQKHKPNWQARPSGIKGRKMRKPASRQALSLWAHFLAAILQTSEPPCSTTLSPPQWAETFERAFFPLSVRCLPQQWKPKPKLMNTGGQWKSDWAQEKILLPMKTDGSPSTSACARSPECRRPFQVFLKWNYRGVRFFSAWAEGFPFSAEAPDSPPIVLPSLHRGKALQAATQIIWTPAPLACASHANRQ